MDTATNSLTTLFCVGNGAVMFGCVGWRNVRSQGLIVNAAPLKGPIVLVKRALIHNGFMAHSLRIKSNALCLKNRRQSACKQSSV